MAMYKFQASSVRQGYSRVFFFFYRFLSVQTVHSKNNSIHGKTSHSQKRQWCSYFSPSQRKVKESQELSQGGLIHHIYHTHLCDQEIKNTASGCNWKTQKKTLNRKEMFVPLKTFVPDLTQNLPPSRRRFSVFQVLVYWSAEHRH